MADEKHLLSTLRKTRGQRFKAACKAPRSEWLQRRQRPIRNQVTSSIFKRFGEILKRPLIANSTATRLNFRSTAIIFTYKLNWKTSLNRQCCYHFTRPFEASLIQRSYISCPGYMSPGIPPIQHSIPGFLCPCW